MTWQVSYPNGCDFVRVYFRRDSPGRSDGQASTGYRLYTDCIQAVYRFDLYALSSSGQSAQKGSFFGLYTGFRPESFFAEILGSGQVASRMTFHFSPKMSWQNRETVIRPGPDADPDPIHIAISSERKMKETDCLIFPGFSKAFDIYSYAKTVISYDCF